MSIVVLQKIAAKAGFHIMGGRILEHESKTIYGADEHHQYLS